MPFSASHIQFGDGISVTKLGNDTIRLDGAGGEAAPVVPGLAPYSVPGVLAVGNGGLRWYAPEAGTVTLVHISVGTAPTGTGVGVSVRVKRNGTHVVALTIGNGYNFASEIPDTGQESFAEGDYFTVDITSVGSTTPGKDLVVQIRTI